ncbi:MAG: S8 family serine peptidase [Verrucomicrobia bacterium]|nr:S8 family serine peptidase [Verrucomicrobiota bacterium]
MSIKSTPALVFFIILSVYLILDGTSALSAQPVAVHAATSEAKPSQGLERAYARISKDFPDVDVTEIRQFHGLLRAQRAWFGHDLADHEVETYRLWAWEADMVHRELVLDRARALGISTGGMDAHGRGYALIGFDEGEPLYVFTANIEAAISTGAHLVRWNADFDPAVGATIDGTGLYVNINDHGEIHEHLEFQLPDNGGSRILVKETPWYDNANRNHMTHVTGTVTAWGYDSRLLGMAPRAWIRSLIQQSTSHISTYGMRFPGELHNGLNPITGELQMKSVIGNTSLGTELPNTRYTALSRSFDQVLRDFPYYVHFYAASNSGPSFETLGGGNPIGKNVITIGAVTDVLRDANGNYTSGGNIASFSSRGPTWDGRIKPDFVANGVGVLSTTGTSSTASWQGTSMASPNAAGSALLLIDYVRQRFPGHFFRSSTYKALLMNTADDRGNPGPDYTFGWGVVNVHKSGQKLRFHAENSYARVLREERLMPGQTWSYQYVSDGTQPVRVSLAWLDVPGGALVSDSTDRSPRLVNDLDMRVIGPEGEVYHPYVLPFVTGQGSTAPFDSSLFNAHATTGDNFTDPAEQVFISAPTAGTYTVQITHKGNLSGGLPSTILVGLSGFGFRLLHPGINRRHHASRRY